MLQASQSDFQWEPTDQTGKQSETYHTTKDPKLIGMDTGRAEAKQENRGQDIEKAQDEAKCAAEAADDFGGIDLFEVGVEHTETDREAVQCESHDRDDGSEKCDAIPRH